MLSGDADCTWDPTVLVWADKWSHQAGGKALETLAGRMAGRAQVRKLCLLPLARTVWRSRRRKTATQKSVAANRCSRSLVAPAWPWTSAPSSCLSSSYCSLPPSRAPCVVDAECSRCPYQRARIKPTQLRCRAIPPTRATLEPALELLAFRLPAAATENTRCRQQCCAVWMQRGQGGSTFGNCLLRVSCVHPAV